VPITRTKTRDEINHEKRLGNKKPERHVKVADFSYESESLAQMIVDAWTNKKFQKQLLDKRNAVRLLAERGVFLKKAHVISEANYNKGHRCKDADEIVFVLPNAKRAGLSNRPLLETAKLLMAITPNGI
jgi:hypothetical protein